MMSKEEFFQKHIMCIGEPGRACGSCPYLVNDACTRPAYDTRAYDAMMEEARRNQGGSKWERMITSLVKKLRRTQS